MADASHSRISLNSVYLRPVLLAVAVAFAPHALHLPLWISLLCICCWGYLLTGARLGWRAPSKGLRNIIAVAATVLLVLLHGGQPGLDAGVSVLAVLLALKTMELSGRRDAMAALLLTSFLIIFNLFFSQDLTSATLALAGVLALAAAMVRTTHPPTNMRQALSLSGKLLLQGAPLALALFVVFPRMPGGLFGYQAPPSPSGFSDTLAPGEVSSLVLSREVAFRVTFDGPFPAPEKRYWRGVVLWEFNGQRWLPRPDMPPRRRALVGIDPVACTISLEPHGQRWLFSLDMPMAATAWSILRQDFTLRSRLKINRKRTYSLRSFLTYDTGPLPEWERRLALQTPRAGNPRARELALSWKQESRRPQEIVKRCLDYFREQGFTYSLRPEEPGPDWVDGFLFETREGFCAHYAASMAFLMRLAGVPARVVSGYQGGEENPMGNYLILRQAHAHAWVEVWLEGQGWVRVDPTGAVAPQRLIAGLLAALAAQGDAGGELRGPLPEWLRPLQMTWDAMNHYWGRKVLDYSWRSQRSLLRLLGLDLRLKSSRLAVALLILGAVSAGILALYFLRRLDLRVPQPPDKAERIWRRLCRRLGRAGMPRPSWQGPLDYASFVSRQRPELSEAIQAAAQYYAWLRYAPPAVQGDVKEFRRHARRVRRILRGSGFRTAS